MSSSVTLGDLVLKRRITNAQIHYLTHAMPIEPYLSEPAVVEMLRTDNLPCHPAIVKHTVVGPHEIGWTMFQ